MNIKKLQHICRMSEQSLKRYVFAELKSTHKVIDNADGYVYAKGTYPVLLVAHLDTVHKQTPNVIVFNSETNILKSPEGIGGDDRCGVYAILEIVKRYNCSVLFCESEEIGGIGAEKFAKQYKGEPFDFNYVIELDRKGSKDAVFYDCDNPEFTDFICKEYWKEEWGTFSDISVLCPFFGIAGVNLSCGYYFAHTVTEYIKTDELQKTIDETCKLLARSKDIKPFEYIEHVYKSKWDNWDEWDSKYGTTYNSYDVWEIVYTDDDLAEYFTERVYANSMDCAIGKFVQKYDYIPFCNVVDVYCLADCAMKGVKNYAV